jgi:hypothetical protein
LSASNQPTPPGPETRLDLSQVAANRDLTLTVEPVEHDADRAHRLSQDGHDARLRRLKEAASFLIGWGVVIYIAFKASAVAFDNTADGATLASWGRTILGSLAGAFAGYLIGRKS